MNKQLLLRRQFLKVLGLKGIFLYLPKTLVDQKSLEKPNILFILADDLGWGQLGCYGSNFYETPNLDNLAAEGMRFTNAYAAAPMCSLTRASIMTGKYPARLPLTDFIKGGKLPAGSKLAHPEWTKFLPLDEITIAEVLKQNGYPTALFGKWHLSADYLPPESLPLNPDKQGFDETFLTYKPSPAMAQEWQTPADDRHNVEVITQKAVQFIENNQQRPFFLFVAHNTIHNPLMEKSHQLKNSKISRIASCQKIIL